jgi:type 1 glutamine amidotransferase
MKNQTPRFLRILPLLLALCFFFQTNANGAPSHIVFVIAEDEYLASVSLPKFAASHLSDETEFKTTFLIQDSKNKYSIPWMEKLKEADLVVLYVRRRSLPNDDMATFRHYLKRGKPLLALRTSSHAWDTRNKGPKNQAEWKTFDPEVLGGNYHGHHGNNIESTITIVPGMGSHTILKDVDVGLLAGKGSLYEVSPLTESAQVILIGTIPNQPSEPILWSHRFEKSKVVYTSLGHVGDFAQPTFNKLLLNTVHYLLEE